MTGNIIILILLCVLVWAIYRTAKSQREKVKLVRNGLPLKSSNKSNAILQTGLQYVAFAFLILLSFLLASESFLAGLIMVTASALVLPVIREKFIPHNLRHPALTFILIIVVFVFSTHILDQEKSAKIAKKQQETAELARQEKEKAIAEFTANPQPKIEEIKNLIEQEIYGGARYQIDALIEANNDELNALNEQLMKIEGMMKEERRIAEAKAVEEAALKKISPDAVWEMTPDQYPRIYQQWGASWVKKLNKMQHDVAKKVAKSPSCDSVSYVGLSEMRSVPKKLAVFFADCTNEQRFYITDKELAEDISIQSKQEKTARLTDSQAIERCASGIRAMMNYPSTFKSSIFSKSVYRAPTGNVVATIDFKGKNGLGLELPMSARCVFDDTGMSPPEITNK